MFYGADLAGVKSTGEQRGRQRSPLPSHLLVFLICFLQSLLLQQSRVIPTARGLGVMVR